MLTRFAAGASIVLGWRLVMDTRKHYTQMNQTEVAALMAKVRSSDYSLKPHATDRMRGRSITEAQVKAMLSYSTIIEAHNNIGSELRVLVRGKVQGNFCCAVVSLTKKEIVTVYWNQAGDHHSTLDKSVYNWQVNLAEFAI